MSEISNPVNWFEIPVADLGRAKNFYEKIFGVSLQHQEMEKIGLDMEMFPMQQGQGAGAGGTLVKADAYEPSHAGTVVYFRVDDIDACLERIVSEGGKVLSPKTSIGEYGHVAHFEDSEGNRVALHAPRGD
jgi:hypothetical protein